MFVSRAPAPPLDAFVDRLWFNAREALPHARERLLPTGRADLVIPLLQAAIVRLGDDGAPRHFRAGVVQGACDRFLVRATEGASRVVGVHFKPGGAGALFGGVLPALRNAAVGLDDVWGAAAFDLQHALREAADPAAALALLERALARRLHDAPPPDPMVAFALARFAREPAHAQVGAVQRASGCGPTSFIARFERAVGLTPKRYARVVRLRALLDALVRIGPRDWAALAADAGYSDQSHLIREFRRLAGSTPGAYRAVQPDQPTHVALH